MHAPYPLSNSNDDQSHSPPCGRIHPFVPPISDSLLGFIGGGFDFSAASPQIQAIDAELSKARSLLSLPPANPLPIGVGFLIFSPTGFTNHLLPILLAHRVSAIWVSFPHTSSDQAAIVAAIRKLREEQDWVVKIFVQVGTVDAAREAVKQGVDVVVAQGTDAGGHQVKVGAGVVALVPEVRDLVEKEGKGQVAVVAAGGLVDGRGAVAGLALGMSSPQTKQKP
jgi:nitronate monooxygenase